MRRRGWLQLFTDLGEAILDVVRAEVGLLQAEWRRWGSHVQAAAIILGAVALVLFWTVPLVLFGFVLLVQRGLEVSLLKAVWITVGAIVVVLLAHVAFVYLRYLKALESPLASARRRLEDHTGWWRSKLLPERALPAASDARAADDVDGDEDDDDES